MSDIHSSSSDTLTIEGKRILIVEDNVENMRLFQAVLKLEGAGDVYGAERAVEGIAIAEKELPDLILMDIQMPGMDGITATRLLKSNPLTAAIPVVAVTASVLESDRREMQDAGCTGYISKPIEPFEFCRQLAKFLALSAAQAAKMQDAKVKANETPETKSQ